MKTTVISQRKAPMGYKQSPHYQYIGRPSVYGNPIRIGKKCQICGEIHDEAGSTIKCYKEYFIKRIQEDSMFKAQVESLRGKILVCFCKPLPCHGDILAEYLNK